MSIGMNLQQSRDINHIDFDDLLPSGSLERTVYVELPMHTDMDDKRCNLVTKLNKSLYEPKKATLARNKLLFDESLSLLMTQ